MKSINNVYKKIWDFNNLYDAFKKTRLGKGDRSEILKFSLCLHDNIFKLSDELKNRTYRLSGYRTFYVYEPKKRKIKALIYRDRIVQRCLCDQVLRKFFDERLDVDNAACRKEKGTHYALNRLKDMLLKYYKKYGNEGYILKCDIRKYFDNIDHQILKDSFYKYIKDRELKWFLDLIIDSTGYDKGLPLGNISSQWFAIFYLDKLDKFVRNELKIKNYSRYMDDFILLHHDKKYIQYCLKKISEFLSKELKLELNEKTQIIKIKNGVDYLGFHTYLTDDGKIIRKIRKHSKNNMKRKVKMFNRKYENYEIDADKVRASVFSWLGHAKHGNTFYLRKKILGMIYLKRKDEKNE